MARIAGINIPDNKHAVVSLTYIFGIGSTTAKKLCLSAGVAPDTRIGDLDEANPVSYTHLTLPTIYSV